MATFFMMGKYSPDALKNMSAERTEKCIGAIQNLGGEVDSIYALLGDVDLVIIATFPDIKTAMKTSVAVSKMTGIGFKTCPAVNVEEFDELMKGA
jgi:uncharacterized protein with GYD domain